MSRHLRAFRIIRAVSVLIAMAALLWSPLESQTIQGRLLNAQTDEAIDLGILTLFTTEGDSVAVTATTPDGRFSVTAPDPGSYLLRASAFGYAEREEGVFELGAEGRVNVEFRIMPRPLELEGILISTDRPTPNHPLIRNGFVDRLRRGLGYFITPRDIERSVYRDTESLLQFIPGVRVVASRTSNVAGRAVVPGPSTDQVLMRNAWGPCAPTVYVDGVRTHYAPETGETLSEVLPIHSIGAAEIYSRPAQVPPEYGGPTGNKCGVIVFWTN